MDAASDPPSLQQAQADVDATPLQFLLLVRKFFMIAHSVPRLCPERFFFFFGHFLHYLSETRRISFKHPSSETRRKDPPRCLSASLSVACLVRRSFHKVRWHQGYLYLWPDEAFTSTATPISTISPVFLAVQKTRSIAWAVGGGADKSSFAVR
jgi:hypothetical protein